MNDVGTERIPELMSDVALLENLCSLCYPFTEMTVYPEQCVICTSQCGFGEELIKRKGLKPFKVHKKGHESDSDEQVDLKTTSTGLRIKKLRNGDGLTWTKFCLSVGIAPETLHLLMFENGTDTVCPYMKLAKHFGVTTEYLISGGGKNHLDEAMESLPTACIGTFTAGKWSDIQCDTIGHRLHLLRIVSMFSTKQMCEITGVNKGRIEFFERKNITPPPETVRRYSEGFQVSEDWIYNGNSFAIDKLIK